MLSSLLCCLASVVVVGDPKPERSAESAAVQQLKAKGAVFCPCPDYCGYFGVEPSPEDRIGFFIWVGGAWTGKPKDLRLLNKLHNLRKLSFTHDKFTDEWCAEVTP